MSNLHNDGILYAKHLVELGGSARVLVYQNNYHAFINGLGDSPTAEHALGEMVRFIQA
jgi:acetyl esterase